MRFPVPPSLHEAEVDRHYARDPATLDQVPDEDIRVLAEAMASARRNAEQLAGLAEAMQNDRTRTPEGAAVELRKAALTIGEKAARSLDGARERVMRNLRQLEAETMAPPPPRDALALQIEAEVRGKLSQLPQDKRRAIIATAIESGDDTILGAVLRGPAMLSGLEQIEHEHARLRWRHARHPEKTAKLDRLQNALEAVERGGNLMLGFVERLSGARSALQAQAGANAADAMLQSIKAAE